MKLFIASDHAGFALKQLIIAHLHVNFPQFTTIDLGTNDGETSVDYPDYGFKLATETVANNAFGIAICGSGIGISIAANRTLGVRCALCTSPLMAQLAREHNNANILAMGQRIISENDALSCVDTFLTTDFSATTDQANNRHIMRIAKLG